jgi:hypothetical protein
VFLELHNYYVLKLLLSRYNYTINEVSGVLLERGSKDIPEEAMNLYKKYIGD